MSEPLSSTGVATFFLADGTPQQATSELTEVFVKLSESSYVAFPALGEDNRRRA